MMGEDSAAKVAGQTNQQQTAEGAGDADATTRADGAEPGDDVIDPRLDRIIGDGLQAHYDDILSAPLPDKFIALLAQLAAKEGSS